MSMDVPPKRATSELRQTLSSLRAPRFFVTFAIHHGHRSTRQDMAVWARKEIPRKEIHSRVLNGRLDQLRALQKDRCFSPNNHPVCLKELKRLYRTVWNTGGAVSHGNPSKVCGNTFVAGTAIALKPWALKELSLTAQVFGNAQHRTRLPRYSSCSKRAAAAR